MTSDQHLALMALMREIEKPYAIYQRAVRKAAQTATDSPENDAVQARGNAALLVIEQAVRRWVVEHPAVEEQPTATACGKCKRPFDPADMRFDGHAQYRKTPYCRGCVDHCRDTEIADHRCVICA